MSKKRGNRGQNHEKNVWALSELKISFKATKKVVLRLQNARPMLFETFDFGAWQRSGHPPPWGEQTWGHGPSIDSTSVGRPTALSYMGTLGVSRGAGARRVVETVFTKRLGISGTADDDTAPHEAQHRTDRSSSHQALRWLQPPGNIITTPLEELLSHHTQLICSWISDSQILCELSVVLSF